LLRDDFGSAKQQIDVLAAQLHDSHFSARLGIIRAQLMQLAYEVEGAFTVMSLDRTHKHTQYAACLQEVALTRSQEVARACSISHVRGPSAKISE
jgi:hypothetical protein